MKAGQATISTAETREDKRQDYAEERLICFGLLGADVVVMVYTCLLYTSRCV